MVKENNEGFDLHLGEGLEARFFIVSYMNTKVRHSQKSLFSANE
jgi:hypothetical protein